jgi:2'-5' RNA ligase
VTGGRGDGETRRRSGEKPWRVFCAIELPSAVRSQIQRHIQQVQLAVPECQASWSRVDNIHLTLKFFGNVDQNKIVLISGAASRAVKDFVPFEISICGTGAFPKSTQPRVLWIGVDDRGGSLARLQQQFEEECAVEGFDKEERGFRPHLTIARIRKPEGARALAEANQKLGFDSMILVASELIVFRSELSPKGSKYTALSRHKMFGELAAE